MTKNILEDSILVLGRLQGIGPRSAQRIMLDLIKKKDTLLAPLITVLQEIKENSRYCNICYNVDLHDKCYICRDKSRDNTTICVVEDVASLWAMEKTKSYNGVYFVLGGNLSAYKGITPKDLHLDVLIDKINNTKIKELIIATSSTIEGHITANYISSNITNSVVTVTALAQGIPVGGELEYLDDVTLSTAIKLRKRVVKND